MRVAVIAALLSAPAGCTAPSVESEATSPSKPKNFESQDAAVKTIYDATLHQSGIARVRIYDTISSRVVDLTFPESTGGDFSCVSDIARACASYIFAAGRSEPPVNTSGPVPSPQTHLQANRPRIFTCNKLESEKRQFLLPYSLELTSKEIEDLCLRFLSPTSHQSDNTAFYREVVSITTITPQNVNLHSTISLHDTSHSGYISISGKNVVDTIWPLGVHSALACAYSVGHWLGDVPFEQGGDIVRPRAYSLLYVTERLYEDIGIYLDVSSVPSNTMTNDDYMKFLERTSTDNWSWRCLK